MASCGHYKLLKRKLDGTVDQIGDDFSLSSPATKIRRLDPELPPIVEEEDQPNDERALVLFKPMNLHSPSDFSLTLSSDLISHFKNNQLSWSKQCDSSDIQDQNEENNRRLAIVPWVPQPSTSSSSSKTYDEYNNNSNAIELMEADEIGEEQEDEGAMMDVEQEDNNNSSTYNYPATLFLNSDSSKYFNSHHLDPLKIFN